MTVNSVDLSPFAAARLKLLLLGPLGALSRRVFDSVRSLHQCETVSADDLVDQEVAGKTSLGAAAARHRAAGRPVNDQTLLAIMRRWFWSRRSDRGFVLAGFPANTAQALVFDQWLDERDEALTACLWLDETGTSTASSPVGAHEVMSHYRERGLVFTLPPAPSAADDVGGLFALLRGLPADR